jgi:hypothetical protein
MPPAKKRAKPNEPIEPILPSIINTIEDPKLPTNIPITVNPINPYIRFMRECGKIDLEPTAFMPNLRLSSKDQIQGGTVHAGLKAPISIVKVRKSAWETLARGLEFYASSPYDKNIQNIYSDNNVIIIVVQAATIKGIKITKFEERFNLNELGSVFSNAQEDEFEQSDDVEEEEYEDDEDTTKSNKKGLTREFMIDSNPAMRKVDDAMLKIISILFLLTNLGGENISSNNNDPSEQSPFFKAKMILQGFIVTSSAKEYLDVGQLYAICGPTVDYNESIDYTPEKILERCNSYGLPAISDITMNISTGGATNSDNMDEGENIGENIGENKKRKRSDSISSTGTRIDNPEIFTEPDENTTETLVDEEDIIPQLNADIIPKYEINNTVDNSSLEPTEVKVSDNNLDNLIASNSDDFAAADLLLGLSEERPDNNMVYESNIMLPRKPMLETIDGAATRIASNQFLTSYCNFTLKSQNTSIDSSFYIDNIDVFLLAIWLTDDPNTKKLLLSKIEQNVNTNILKQTDINNINTLLHKNDDTRAQIDTCYYILKNTVLRTILSDLSKELSSSSNILQEPKNALLMNNELYFIVSAACFLFKYNEQPEIIDDLIKCNFDSLCHDNEESQIYRQIMILIFILKNSTNDIKQNLKDLFPSFFLRDSDNWDEENIKRETDKTKIVNQEIFSSDLEKNYYYNYINKYILQFLSHDQQNIFKIISRKKAKDVESGLYLRLRNKSCYVFQVLHTSMVVIVGFAHSAHESFVPAQQEIKSLSKSVFKLQSLDQGVFIPHYTNCAIDAPLKHGLSLSNYDISGVDSKVMVTAITRNDAASQNMSRSEQYSEPICMKIDVENMIDPNTNEHFNFTYQFMYGETSKTIAKKEIECPTELDRELCEKYRKIIQFLDSTTFYYKKQNIGPFKDETTVAIKSLLEDIQNNISRLEINGTEAGIIRDNLSRLFTKSICGKTTIKKPKCSDVTVNLETLIEGKTEFLEFLIDYISNPEKTINDKKALISYTYKLLSFTNETKNLDKLILNVESYVSGLPSSGKENINVSVMTVNQPGQGKQPVTNKRTSRGNPRQNGGRDFPQQVIPQQVNPLEQSMLAVKTQTIEPKMLASPKLEPKMLQDNIQEDNVAKGVVDTQIEETIKYSPHEIQLSYSSMFGEYGFDMNINEDGEYELIILNTKEDYNNYLLKYGLIEDSIVSNQENNNMEMDIGTGGKIQKNKKTKKHKRIKHKTRRLQNIEKYKTIKHARKKLRKTKTKK